MTLTAADVAEIIRLIEQSTFDELSLEMNGVKLTLHRAGASGRLSSNLMTANPLQPSAAIPPMGAPAAAPAITPAVAPSAADPRARDINSPMLGTFYRAPKPGSAPFVEIGAAVEEDSVIAIIEVMKLMNTVRAGVKGVITEILPADGTLVEFGQLLMRVRKSP